jgi:hypothetical protein
MGDFQTARLFDFRGSFERADVIGFSKAPSRQTLPAQSMTVFSVLERWPFFSAFLSIYFFTWTVFVLPPSVKLAAC